LVIFAMLAAPVAAAPVALKTNLTGAAEFGQGDADGTWTAGITLSAKKRTICFDLAVQDIALPATAAIIHCG